MIKTVVTDFSKVLLFAKDPHYRGGLNELNNRLLLGDPAYPFFEYFVLNEELLRYYKKLNNTVPVFVFTSETVQDHPAIKETVRNAFRGVFSAKELHLSKAEPKTYEEVAKLAGCRPDEVLYVDDKASNLESAVRAGLNTVLYTGNDEIIRQLDTLAKQ